MASQKQLTLKEIDPTSGQTTKTYVLSRTNAGLGEDKRIVRYDHIPLQRDGVSARLKPSKLTQSTGNLILQYIYAYLHPIVDYLQTLFLPTGYPHTVTPDYTPYQIYDSIQAFASTIAGLLSSRAVLQSLNIVAPASSVTSASTSDGPTSIPADSASAATAATLLSILQSTLANMTTILFASHAAPRISSDVKFFRFLADVANDAAFVLDLLAPSLPNTFSALLSSMTLFLSHLHLAAPGHGYMALLHLHRLELLSPFIPSPKVAVLCTSSMLRAICGVAAGSSKAVLSAHFARNNPESVGDLNAKDGSQETVVNLLGMWIGGLLVSHVNSVPATWTWMMGLLVVHLWANYRAVGSVRLRGMNRERAGRVMMRVVEGGQRFWDDVGVDDIGRSESVLGLRSCLNRWVARLCGREDGAPWRSWRVGVSVEDFLKAVGSNQDRSELEKRAGPSNVRISADSLASLISLFEKEAYLLWIGEGSEEAVVALKKDARPIDQLRAWYHAFLAKKLQTQSLRVNDGRLGADLLTESHEELRRCWKDVRKKLQTAGWDLDSTNLEDGQGVRIDLS